MVKAGRIGFPLGCLMIPNQRLDDLDGDFLCKSDPVPVMRQGQQKWGAFEFRTAFAGWTRNQLFSFSVWFENDHSLYGNESISHGSQEVWKVRFFTWTWDMLLHRKVLCHLKHHQHHIRLAVPQITIGGMVCPCDVFDLYPQSFWRLSCEEKVASFQANIHQIPRNLDIHKYLPTDAP